jgi:hypothetical protein
VTRSFKKFCELIWRCFRILKHIVSLNCVSSDIELVAHCTLEVDGHSQLFTRLYSSSSSLSIIFFKTSSSPSKLFNQMNLEFLQIFSTEIPQKPSSKRNLQVPMKHPRTVDKQISYLLKTSFHPNSTATSPSLNWVAFVFQFIYRWHPHGKHERKGSRKFIGFQSFVSTEILALSSPCRIPQRFTPFSPYSHVASVFGSNTLPLVWCKFKYMWATVKGRIDKISITSTEKTR